MLVYSVYYTDKPGGFCKRLYRLLNALAADGHEVNYFCLDKPPQTLDRKVKWIKIPFPLETRAGFIFWMLFSVWSALFCFWQTLAGRHSSRWMAFSPYYAALLAPTKLILGSMLVCFIRSKLAPASESWLTSNIEGLTQKICLKLADNIVVQTQANKKLAISLGCPERKISVLSNNIDKISPTTGQPSESLGLKILTTGVFTKKKNLDFLIQVWKELKLLCDQNKITCPTLKIVGLIRDQQFRNSHPAEIEISAWEQNIEQEYQKADVYLHPSSHEGMPNSVLEALSFGLCALVADTAELTELVGTNDLTFSLANPAVLARKLFEIQTSPELLNSLKQLSQRRALELCFDWNSAACQITVN